MMSLGTAVVAVCMRWCVGGIDCSDEELEGD